MNRQQEYLLKMLREIHELCEDNGITYYIGMGTLIGAVRNGGFLPWDDDADILMTYGEFERFKELCKTALPDNRHLGSADMHETYGHLLPRYVSKDTTCIHTCQSLHDDIAGEVIDIFVLDPIADGDEAYDAYIQDLYLYSAVVNYANAAGTRFEIDAKRFKEYKELEHSEGRIAVAKRLEQNLASHFDEGGSRYAFRWQGVPICFDRSWFDEAVPLRFEDTTVMAPCGINEFLTCYYGEEWPDIPASVSPAKHNTAASLDFSYAEALEFYRPSYNRADLLKESERWQYRCFSKAREENTLKDALVETQAALVSLETANVVSEHRAEFDDALACRDGGRLSALLEPYLAWQTSGDAIGRHADKLMYRLAHPVLAVVSDCVFEAGLVVLMETNRVHFVSRLLEVRLEQGLPFTQLMSDLQSDLDLFNSAANDYHSGNYERGFEKARSLIDKCSVPCPALFLRLTCALAGKRFEATGDEGDGAVFKSLVDMGRGLFPADGTFAKFEADYLSSTGEEEHARGLYLRAAESTRNGLTLRAIAEKTGYHPRWLRRTAWARKAGVPDWKEDEPDPIVNAGSVANGRCSGRIADERQDYLLGLLSEIARFCELRGYRYVLGPAAAYAVVKQGKAPDKLASYSIVVEPKGMSDLFDSFREMPPANRILVPAKGASGKKAIALRYCGTDSVYVNLMRKPERTSCLSVSIITLELAEYPRDFKFMLQHGRTRFASVLLAPFSGRLFKTAMRLSASSSASKILSDGKRLPFDERFIEDGMQVEFDGRTFRVPSDVDGYAKAFSARPSKGNFAVPASYLCSASVSIDQAISLGVIPEGLPALRARLDVKRAMTGDVRKRFRTNFSQVKLAVALKQVSLNLLPIKTAILEADADGDDAYLSKALRDYLKLADEYEKVGDLNFDEDLYCVMMKSRNRTKS